jgi:predicted Zn-dependent protease
VSKATFLPAQNSKLIAALAFEIDNIQVKFLHSAHKEKLRYSQSETVFRVIDDPSLQKNIERIGASLIPAYQKALPNDDPSKIHFEFYAVDSQSLRWEVCTRNGMILLPKLVIDRLKSDDQIAAVLADGLAFDLQRQAVGTTLANRAFLGANAAADVAAALVPGANIPVAVGSTIAARAQYVARQKQRGRIALALMNDAGYDLAQAPEAWRLLTPKNLPANPDSLKYPDESSYQMSVIYQQYRDEGSAALR